MVTIREFSSEKLRLVATQTLVNVIREHLYRKFICIVSQCFLILLIKCCGYLIVCFRCYLSEALEWRIVNFIFVSWFEHKTPWVVYIACHYAVQTDCFSVPNLTVREYLMVDEQSISILLYLMVLEAYWHNSCWLDEVENLVLVDFWSFKSQAFFHWKCPNYFWVLMFRTDFVIWICVRPA